MTNFPPPTPAPTMEVLALRAYPGLQPSGLCSRHSSCSPLRHAECKICYPDWQALISAHLAVMDKLREDLMALIGLKDPPNGKIGTDQIVEELRRKLQT